MGKNKIFYKIYKSKRLRAKFIEAFKAELEACGEILIGDPTDQYIFDVFKRQGYWSGVRYNIHFDEEMGFEYEERRFGR